MKRRRVPIVIMASIKTKRQLTRTTTARHAIEDKLHRIRILRAVRVIMAGTKSKVLQRFTIARHATRDKLRRIRTPHVVSA